MAAIRAHKGVKVLKKARAPVLPKNEMSLEESLKAQLAKGREAFGGGGPDLTSLSNLIPEPEVEPGSSSALEGKTRLEICRDRRDQRSCKIFVSCVNLSRKQRSFFKLCKFTHT